MPHILDNIIWNSIKQDNKSLSFNNGSVGLFYPDIAPFAGLINYTSDCLEQLYQYCPTQRTIVLFSINELQIPVNWQLIVKDELVQMIYFGDSIDKNNSKQQIVSLNVSHVPQMLWLTKQTNPGPFFERTILFGNYIGIFENDNLVSMAGLRLQTENYCEISAVCTHPNYLGKGFAAILIKNLIGTILNFNKTPFLHVLKNNSAALSLYKKLGFQVRQNFYLYVLKK